MKTIFESSRVNTILGWIAHRILSIMGWEARNILPSSIEKCVVIAAPHTSNIDVVIMLLAGLQLGLPMRWMGKKQLARFPFHAIMTKLGMIPVNRNVRGDKVLCMADYIATHDGPLMVMVAPEGTRSFTPVWRSGFYHIARMAHVPIAYGYVDYRCRYVGIGGYITPTEDHASVMEHIRAFYSGVTPRYPERYNTNWTMRV